MTEIQIQDDFDLDRIAGSGQCFRWEREADGAYRIVHRVHCVTIHPLGEGRYALSCTEGEYQGVWRGYFDLGENYRLIREKIRKEEDPFLFAACQYGRGIRILRQDLWETLISFIISQNRNIPAIRKSIGMLCEAAGREMADGAGRPYRLFPSPEEILSLPDEVLAACKLGYRCRYVKAAAADVAGGRISLPRLREAREEDAVRMLETFYGVGPKVASCVALFGLHHADAFPVDVWIRRILAQEYPGGYPMERYRPYNGIYQQYMFYYYRAENAKT